MYIAETYSTNSLLREQYMDSEQLFHIRTDYQSAGRGQQGNSWESERGQNLLCSVLLRDTGIAVQQQFGISMLTSVALYHTVAECLDETVLGLSARLSIKWPNDLYYADSKLAGILVENSLTGTEVSRSILGIGLNVNQTQFLSDAPNPTSLALITGHRYPVDRLMERLLHFLEEGLAHPEHWREQYMAHLYRRQGFYPYVEREVDTTPTMNQSGLTPDVFMAEIADITPTGCLCLCLQDGEQRTYHFKQVRYVMPPQ